MLNSFCFSSLPSSPPSFFHNHHSHYCSAERILDVCYVMHLCCMSSHNMYLLFSQIIALFVQRNSLCVCVENRIICLTIIQHAQKKQIYLSSINFNLQRSFDCNQFTLFFDCFKKQTTRWTNDGFVDDLYLPLWKYDFIRQPMTSRSVDEKTFHSRRLTCKNQLNVFQIIRPWWKTKLPLN